MGHPESSSSLSGALRRELAARGNRLRASLVVGKNGLSDAVVVQVRRVFEGAELIKVRVYVDRGDEAGDVGDELARRVPCHVVKRVGKVLLLYQPRPEDSEAAPKRKH